jgi:hypothetical protein
MTRRSSSHGYTLLEALIALSIFMVVIVPLLGRLATGAGMSRARDALAASCLIEQTAVGIELYPDEVKPVERRRVGPRVYEIRTDASGSGLQTYRIRVSCRGKRIGEAIVYRHEER